MERPLGIESLLDQPAPDDPRAIQLEAGKIEAQLGALPTARMTGGVILRTDDKVAGADTAWYDPETKAMHLEGDVRYEDPGTQIIGQSKKRGRTQRATSNGGITSASCEKKERKNTSIRSCRLFNATRKDGTCSILCPI